MILDPKTLSFLKENKFMTLLYLIVILLLIPVRTIGFSHFISKITTSAKGNNFDMSVIYMSIIYIILIYLGTRLLYIAKYFLQIYLENNLVYLIRTNIFKDILNKVQENYDQIEKGKIISYLDIIPQIYEDKVRELLSRLLPECSAIVILTGYFFWVDYKLGILILLMLVVLIFSIFWLSKKCVKKKIEQQETYYNNNEDIQDKLSNVFSILVSNKSKDELKKNCDKENIYRDKKFKSDYQDLISDTTLTMIIIFFTVLVLVYYISIFKRRKNIQVAITSFLVFFSLINYIDHINWYLLSFINNLSLINQYQEEIKNEHIIEDGKITNFINKGIFKFHNVSFSYNQKQILKNVNFEFPSRKLNIILGSSGTGKSTIFKLLLRLKDPTTGKVTLDNTDLKDSKISYLRENIGVVNQNTFLFNNTIFENIKYTNQDISKEQVSKFIESSGLNKTVFKNIDLDTNTGVEGFNLSNGQRQMVLILREYFADKQILLMDEPTSSLDTQSKGTIMNFIKLISNSRTVIITTHDNFVRDKADIIYDLNKLKLN